MTHGNVGLTQFGYRFSLDVQPLLFVILATVFERGMSPLGVGGLGGVGGDLCLRDLGDLDRLRRLLALRLDDDRDLGGHAR